MQSIILYSSVGRTGTEGGRVMISNFFIKRDGFSIIDDALPPSDN